MAELTAELVADMGVLSDPQISPDGRLAAYVLAPMGRPAEHPASALWIAPVDGSAAPRQFTTGIAEDCRPRWSPDGRYIAFLSDRAQRGTSQLYLISSEGGEAWPLTAVTNQRPVLTFAWSPDGSFIAYTSADEPDAEDARRKKERDDADVFGERRQDGRLRVLCLASGELRTLFAPERHIAELAWSPRGDAIACISWQAPGMEFSMRDIVCERVPLAGGPPQPICTFAGAAASLCWSADAETLLFIATVSGNAQSSLAVWSVPAQGGQPRRLAQGEDSCARELYQPPGAPRAAVAIASGLNTVLAWLDPAGGAIEPFYHASQSDGPADLSAWSVVTHADGETVLAGVRGSGMHPWELWGGRFRRQGRYPALQQLSHHKQELEAVQFVSQEPFRWHAPDGFQLDGLLIRPRAMHAEVLPLVTLVHDGPYGRWTLGFNVGWGNWAQWLALAGYAVLLPNPRGGMGHGEPFAATTRGDVGGTDYRDVLSGVDAMIAQGIADPARLGIGGWSQGGFMSAWAVTQTQRFKAAVVGAGPTDWGMLTATSDMPGFERELGGGAPWDGAGPHRHAQLSPISFVNQVSTPVLLLHGQNDERVPVSQAISFHRALRERDVPSALVIYPREPHGIRERAHQIDILRRVRRWFAAWL